MAKGGISRSSTRSMLGGDNNNFLGTLLSSLTFGFFDVNVCDAEDNTWYCKFSRFFGALMKVIFIVIIFYVIYYIFFTKNVKRGKSRIK